MTEFEQNGAYIVSWDFSNKDAGVLVVGRQVNGVIKIVNAFEGKDARDIYERLSTVNGKETTDGT